VVALLDLGAEITNINILRGTQTLFSRSVPIGGSKLTQALADKLGLQESQAEALKIQPGERLKELLEALGPVLESLLGELRLSFDYFESQYDKRVEHLFLSGGSSRFGGLKPLLKEHFQAEVTTWNPFEGTALAESASAKLKEGAEEFTVAFGLALRAPDDHA
jgi:type IV pilus assembly protein PilM